MAPNEDKIYDLLYSVHAKSFDLVSKALKIDETYTAISKKSEAISLYKKGLLEMESVLKNVDWHKLKGDKKERARRLVEKMNATIRSTKGRVTDLEKQLGTIAIYPKRAHSREKPSISRNMCRNSPNLHKNMPSDLLRGVDKKLGASIVESCMEKSPSVKFDSICGLEEAKQALNETIIFPALNPALFTGLRTPVKGILLFGPPGNGKTLLAKAVATESNYRFFNISASTLMSKWVGEAEKMVKALFQIARNAQPSIIFIDEIDSILMERSEKENEVCRRMKTEFLLQFDGLISVIYFLMATNESDRILLMGATNRPYELDDAAVRRFPKRILIDLPGEKARLQLLAHLLAKQPNSISETEMCQISSQTGNYSNSDLVSLAQEAAMVPLREIRKDKLPDLKVSQIRTLEYSDFCSALHKIRPSVKLAQMDKLRRYAVQKSD